MSYTLADFCQGHGTTCSACLDPWYGCDTDHGTVSFCDGSCTSAANAYADYLIAHGTERPADTTDSITLEVGADGGWHRYTVTFEGPDADAWATAYITARSATHSFSECITRPFSHTTFPQVAALLYPVCEHGMDAHNCYGPGHYMTRDQEIAMGWA